MKLINQSCKIWNFMTRRVILRTWIRYRIFNVALCLSQWKMVKKQYQQIWFPFFSLLWKEFLSSETIAGLSSQTAGFPQYSLLNFLLANFFRLYLWVRPFHPSIHPPCAEIQLYSEEWRWQILNSKPLVNKGRLWYIDTMCLCQWPTHPKTIGWQNMNDQWFYISNNILKFCKSNISNLQYS